MPIPGFLVATALGGLAGPVIRRVGGAIARRPVTSALVGTGLGTGLGFGIPSLAGLGGDGDRPRRRRRRGLTATMMRDIIFLSQNVSKRAAENYVVGVGRG